ncbi:TerB family tellurite resistance protein [Gammaproteobacteria bacterium]|nr:TerB family tellurite resistance protein [Gammaproteobacteria bacterium]
MLNLFKKKIPEKELTIPVFEVELIGSVLAYEIARSDGEISDDEATLLLGEIKKISEKVGKDEKEILKLIETHSSDSVSFYEFIEDINKHFTKEDKILLISFLWDVAYADSNLDVDEERLIRRIADLIRIKDMDVLKLKDRAKN